MIKGLILDVDGVLVGGKQGYNWPNPHPQIIQALKLLRKKGITVSLCTGKGTFAIKDIVLSANLDNVHIGDGGALVVDIIHNKIIDQHIIKSPDVKSVVKTLLSEGIYIELYTQDGYFIQKDQIGEKTTKHKDILYKEPFVVNSLEKVANDLQIVKIMPVADDENQKKIISNLFEPYQKNLTLQWGVHPIALPYQFGMITSKGISKKHAALVISQHTGIPLSEMLGVGDSMSDWLFMEICGFVGAMGNASQELKEKVLSKKESGYIGKSVDENGLIDILDHFDLLD